MGFSGYPSARSMGYDVHITRAEDWLESEQTPISLPDWIAYAKSDPEFRLDGFAEAENGLRYDNVGLAVWTAHSSGRPVWFDPTEGRVVVKNPDEEILRKMAAVAAALKARVLGDDGEAYDPPPPSPTSSSGSKPPWWRRLFVA